MNLTRTGDNSNPDFFIEGDHARMSQRKVAEIIGISNQSVSRWCVTHLPNEIAKITAQQGLDGVTLNQVVGYYATSKSVSEEVRNNCVQVLIESSKVGFQILIDEMAGLNKEKELPEKELFDLYCDVTDKVFKGVNIKPELISGLKLNHAMRSIPQLSESFKEQKALLRDNTASEVKLMTPRELGRLIGVSAQEINKRLIAHGLQTKNDGKKSRKDTTYIPTDRGAEFCSYTLSTGSKDDKTTYQQLLWYESVLSVID